MNMRGELIFDTKNLIIMKDSHNQDCFYAIDLEMFREVKDNYYDKLRAAYRTSQTITAPELEVTVLVEKEPGKFDLGTVRKVVSFDSMKGVLISCN